MNYFRIFKVSTSGSDKLRGVKFIPEFQIKLQRSCYLCKLFKGIIMNDSCKRENKKCPVVKINAFGLSLFCRSWRLGESNQAHLYAVLKLITRYV